MIDVIVRQNSIYKEIFHEYKLNTDLYNRRESGFSFLFDKIIQTMVVNEVKWTRINKILRNLQIVSIMLFKIELKS